MRDRSQNSRKGKPKAFDREKVKTVEQWRADLDRDAADRKRGNWKLLTREMSNSRAFGSLSLSGMRVVLAMLDKLSYPKNDGKDRKGVKYGGAYLENGGVFYLTGNELKARYQMSDGAIADGRREAWEKGFFDTLVTGTVHHRGEFQYSNRWKDYPNGNYKPHNQPQPGQNVYSSISENLAAKNAGKHAAKSAGYAENGSPAKSAGCDAPISEFPAAKNAGNYNVTSAAERSGAVTGKRNDGTPPRTEFRLYPCTRRSGGPPNNKPSEHREAEGGTISPLDPKVLRMGLPAKVIAHMKGRGHLCTSAERHAFNDVQLDFSSGVTLHIRPTDYELVSNGAGWTFHDLEELNYLLLVSVVGEDNELSRITAQVDEIMFDHRYGHHLRATKEHGEICLGFAEDVRVWVRPDSIRLARPGHRNLTVTDPDRLNKKLARRASDPIREPPQQACTDIRP